MKVNDNIYNYLLRRRKGSYYFFDEEGIYRKITGDMELSPYKNNHWPENLPLLVKEDEIFDLEAGEASYNALIIRKAINMLVEGDTIQRLEELINSVTLEKQPPIPELDRFITRIDPPIFERVPENPNIKTFDFIRVYAYLNTNFENKDTFLKENIKAIKQKVLDKIQTSKSFQKYGVPVNVLKLSNLTLTKNATLVFLFELKIRE